jgi:hypothetical protein
LILQIYYGKFSYLFKNMMPVLHFCSVNNEFFTSYIYFYLAKTQFFKPNFPLFL